MPISESEADAAALAEFLVGDEWPFHGNSRPSRETVESWLAAGPEIRRIEGHTRRDNLAMQHVLERCGYVREAHHRQAWPGSDGRVHDSFGYAILRQDWLSGDITPIDL